MQRPIALVLPSVRAKEGAGFDVRRPFPTAAADHLGPFLLLDEMGPADNAPGEAKGAPDHPHRGFETVTYVLAGEIEHADSVGNRGLIRPGDVQWMTAGSGIVHSELPSETILARGGRTHGFQLWVNLPQKAKWRRPRYQDLTGDRLPAVDLHGGRAVVVGGQAFGTAGPADTFLPVTYVHLSLDPEAAVALDVEPERLGFVYVFAGWGTVSGTDVAEGETAVFGPGRGDVDLRAGPTGLEAMIGTAEPLREPVARYGPFVMNTREEILQAFDDYRAGRLGTIDPERA